MRKNVRDKKLVKRSAAAELLDRDARTLRRYELQGLLQPIKLNSRSTCYYLSDVVHLQQAGIPSVSREVCATARSAAGTFTKSTN
jgi:hypothetical protein